MCLAVEMNIEMNIEINVGITPDGPYAVPADRTGRHPGVTGTSPYAVARSWRPRRGVTQATRTTPGAAESSGPVPDGAG
jgi:hypothetical protein